MVTVSNSIEVSLPKGRCRRLRWWVRSIRTAIVRRSSFRFGQRCRTGTVLYGHWTNASIAALSPRTLTRPIADFRDRNLATITGIQASEGRLHLGAIKDVFTNRFVGHSIDSSPG